MQRAICFAQRRAALDMSMESAAKKPRRKYVDDSKMTARLALIAHALPRAAQSRNAIAAALGVDATSGRIPAAVGLLGATGCFQVATTKQIVPILGSKPTIARHFGWASETVKEARTEVRKFIRESPHFEDDVALLHRYCRGGRNCLGGEQCKNATGCHQRYDNPREVHICPACGVVYSYKQLDGRSTRSSVAHHCPLKPGGTEKCGGGPRCQGWGSKTNTRDPTKKKKGIFQSNPCWKLLKNKKGLDYVKTRIQAWKDSDEYKDFLLSSPEVDQDLHDDD